MIELLKKMIMEEVVKGRALDRYATMASRETISAIKDEAVREAFNTNGRVDFALDVPEITDDIDYLRVSTASSASKRMDSGSGT